MPVQSGVRSLKSGVRYLNQKGFENPLLKKRGLRMRTPVQSGVHSLESGVRHLNQKGSENLLFMTFLQISSQNTTTILQTHS
jgi:hypothetical protein